MGAWFLSRRDSTIVARHEVPGMPRRGKKAQPRVYPGLAENRRFALKGLEIRTQSGSKVRSRFSPYLSAPSGLIPVRGINPG